MPVQPFSTALCALAMMPMTLLAAPPASPPPTEKRPVKDVIHGTAFIDDYRWLEGDNSNPADMGKVTDEVVKWTDAQNAYTRAVLDGLPGREALVARLRPLMEIGAVSSPVMRGEHYFYMKREGKDKQPKLYVRKGHAGKPRVLVDPAAIDPSGLTAMGGFDPSPDGTLLAYGLFRAGDENTTVRILDVETGEKLEDEITGKADVIQWLPDNSGVFYTNLENVKDPYSRQIMFRTLGKPASADKRLFRQFTREQDARLATTWGPGASVSRDGRYMTLIYWTSTSSNDLWVVDLDQWRKDGRFLKREVAAGVESTFFGGVEDGTLYMLTDYQAGRKRIVAIDVSRPDLRETARDEGGRPVWRTVVPEHPAGVIKEFGLAGGAGGKDGLIAVDFEERAASRLRLYSRSGEPRGELKLPGIGSAGISVEHDRTEAFVGFTSFNYPTTIFRVDLASPDAEPAVWERPDVPVDPSIVTVKQVFFDSKDGTQVPMFIVHKPGLKLDGNNPTLMTGYGGFNISQTPSFAPTLFPWLEAGGVFVSVNLRGGGEMGRHWHVGGMRENKQTSFDDMIAAAEWLVEKKYTAPARLAASGGSNGGLLMGALITQRPDLFKAIICAVPLLDMLRYQNFLMARYWVPEYGSAESESEFEWLSKYSPYQHVKAGTAYPAVLFTAGENDTRVHALHARKMAAAVQAATTSDPSRKPVLLWVDREAGHGAGKPLDLRIRDVADARSFLMWQLGVELPRAE